jgi:hypothetical protein
MESENSSQPLDVFNEKLTDSRKKSKKRNREPQKTDPAPNPTPIETVPSPTASPPTKRKKKGKERADLTTTPTPISTEGKTSKTANKANLKATAERRVASGFLGSGRPQLQNVEQLLKFVQNTTGQSSTGEIAKIADNLDGTLTPVSGDGYTKLDATTDDYDMNTDDPIDTPHEATDATNDEMQKEDVPSDEESDVSFDLVEMDFGKKLEIKDSSYQWLKVFDADLVGTLYFGDHMAPFRQLLFDMKDSPEIEKQAEIKALLKGASRKVFVAVSGSRTNPYAVKTAIEAIVEVTGEKPTEMVSIQGSAWMIAQMKQKEDIEKLVVQRTVVDQTNKMLVVFRAIALKASTERVVEVKNLRSRQQIKEMREALASQGVNVVQQFPPEEDWSTTYTERVVWKLEVPSPSYTIPTSVVLSKGATVKLMNPPSCATCHSDDHHSQICVWRNYLRNLLQ